MRKKASIYNIPSNHARAVESEIDLLAHSARGGYISGLSYAASSPQRRVTVGSAGTHIDKDRAISALFQAAVALVDAA